MRLDRPGIFKAVPKNWALYVAASGSAACNVEYRILAQLDGSTWIDWGGYDEYTIFGDHWIVKKDGSVNDNTVRDLAEVFGWKGSVAEFLQPVPNVEVQITVREEVYEGKPRLKVAWLNPGDYAPTAKASDPDAVKQIDAQFGSLLRAAASAAIAAKPAAAATKPAPQPKAPPKPVTVPPSDTEVFEAEKMPWEKQF